MTDLIPLFHLAAFRCDRCGRERVAHPSGGYFGMPVNLLCDECDADDDYLGPVDPR
jgi:hypothetical protein